MSFDIVQELLALSLIGTEWVLWLLVLLSVISVAIMLERCWCFYRLRLDLQPFTHELSRCLDRHEYERGIALCEQSRAPESQVALAAFHNRNRGSQAVEQSMFNVLTSQRQYLDRGLVVLGTLGNNAPFIGLFGTVLGIIQAFNDLAQHPAGGVAVVMAGISEALVATAVGLLVAIPAVIAFNGFQRLVKRRIANADVVMKLVLTHGAAAAPRQQEPAD